MTAIDCSTHTIDTEGEQDGHVRANCIGSCPVQPADQLNKRKEGQWLANMTQTVAILLIAGMASSW